MPILFGTPSNYNSFNVVGQNIQESERVIQNRAIEGNLRSYRYPIRADISVEFDLLSESDTGDLQKQLYYGTPSEKIFIAAPSDESLLRYFGKLTGSTFEVAHIAYKADNSNGSLPPSTASEFTQPEYNAVGLPDGNTDTWTASGGNYYHLFFYFDLTSYLAAYDKDNIKRLLFDIIGMDDHYVSSIWNDRTSAWEELFNSDNEGLAASITTIGMASRRPDVGFFEVDDYINSSNIVIFRIRTLNFAETLELNYVELLINGFSVVADNPQVDLNFRDRFIGAGYRGSLNLVEV